MGVASLSSSFPRPLLRHSRETHPSFPAPFFVIPEGKPTARTPPNNSPTLSGPTPPSFPRPLLRHSREGGNPRPGPEGKSPTVSRSTTPVIPAPPSSSFPRRREPTARTKWRVTHCQPEHHPRHSRAPFRHSREGGNPRPGLSQQLSHPQRTNTPLIPAPPSVIPAKAGTHGPDQVATHPQSAGAPPPSFPRRASPDSIPNHHHVTTIN